ncbi:MAG: hypothetical protein KF851_08270 [Pirellulaceae bacterium]|nr:hypothetical protein [Pirellulaceae bacterium]
MSAFHFLSQSTPSYESEGSDSSSWNSTLRNAVSRVDAEEPETVDDDNDDPVHEVTTDDHSLSQSGSGSDSFSSSYRLKTTIPDSIDQYFLNITGLDGGDGSPSEIIVNYKLVADGDIVDESEFEDSTVSSTNVTADGIFLTTDGQFKITNTYSGKWHNPEAITNTKITDFPGYTNTITKVIEPNELIVENNDESTVTFDYDGFGVRLNFIQPEEGGDVLSAESFGLQTKATPVGKRTTTETSQGNSSVASKSKQTETNYFPGLSWNFMHEHRAESLTTSDWDVGDEWVLEFLSGGGSTVTYTPSGTTNTHRSLDTQGEYQWRNDRVLPSGPYSGALARNWGESEYFSNGQLIHGVTRSGSVSATYDDEGNAVSASGSLQLAHTYSGTAISYISAWGKSVLGSESGTGTMVVATRNFTQGRNGSFNGGETSTLTPQINSEGNIVFDTTSTGLTGTRSGSQTTTDVRSVYEIYNGTVQTSGNLYSLTDSGESPPGGGSSINYLLPSTDFADDPPPEQNASLSTGGLGYFASAFGFRGGIVGASFATALPGDPTLPGSTTFGDTNFDEKYTNFQSQQQDDAQALSDLIMGIMILKYGSNDPYIFAFQQYGGRLELFEFWWWSGSTSFYEDKFDGCWAPVFQFDLSVHRGDPEAAADELYSVIRQYSYKSYGKAVYSKDEIARFNEIMELSSANAREQIEDVFRIGMGAATPGDLILLMHDLSDTKLTLAQKSFLVALSAIPFVKLKGLSPKKFLNSDGTINKGMVRSVLDDVNKLKTAAPKRALLRDSLMSLRNKVPSSPLTKAEMEQFAAELREFGVWVQYGKKYENGNDMLRFMPTGPGRAQLDLPANPTWYEALHEAGHFMDWINRGKPNRDDWLKIPYHEREKAVYDWIKANWWDRLTPEQQSDAFLQWMVEYQKFQRGN